MKKKVYKGIKLRIDMNNKKDSEENKSQAYFYKDYLDCVMTIGIKQFADEHKCYWLMTDIISVAMVKFKDKQNFLNCNLKILPGQKAKLIIDDGDNNIIYTQDYEYTTLKEHVHLYCIKNELNTYTLMNPNEY